MANPLDENVTAFLDSVFSNETISQADRKQLIHTAMQSLQSKVTDGTHQRGASIQFGDFIKEARRLRKKNVKNKKGDIDEFDVNELGC